MSIDDNNREKEHELKSVNAFEVTFSHRCAYISMRTRISSSYLRSNGDIDRKVNSTMPFLPVAHCRCCVKKEKKTDENENNENQIEAKGKEIK